MCTVHCLHISHWKPVHFPIHYNRDTTIYFDFGRHKVKIKDGPKNKYVMLYLRVTPHYIFRLIRFKTFFRSISKFNKNYMNAKSTKNNLAQIRFLKPLLFIIVYAHCHWPLTQKSKVFYFISKMNWMQPIQLSMQHNTVWMIYHSSEFIFRRKW